MLKKNKMQKCLPTSLFIPVTTASFLRPFRAGQQALMLARFFRQRRDRSAVATVHLCCFLALLIIAVGPSSSYIGNLSSL